MNSRELKQTYIDFFAIRGHGVIPNASLIPDNDPTALFTSAGMHPLVPFLLGEPHPLGKRLVSVQRCLRTGDIEEVGDKVHHTFFEMLGNWSLGDYFKEEAISFSWQFLTSEDWLNIDPEKLAVSVFAGDEDAPFDAESYQIWRGLGMPEERIAKLPKKNNWWGPVGETGPCGPDTEMFYWTGQEAAPAEFDPEDSRWVEIWNDVFMQYNRTQDGKYEPLTQKNVDTGMGVERTLAVLAGLDDNYRTDVFWPIIQEIEKATGKSYEVEENKPLMRVVADHLRAATFLIKDGILPANKERGYVLRRLLRRAAVKMNTLKGGVLAIPDFLAISQKVMEIYRDEYFDLGKQSQGIKDVITVEIEKFSKSLNKGLKEVEKLEKLDGKTAFDLYQTYGFPLEITLELAKQKGQEVDLEVFQKEFEKHQELSRTASSGMFKGGLADNSEISTKYHTATHLLQAALRKVLGTHIQQKGSNITAERLRFDFSHPAKMTEEEVRQVEEIINQKIKENLEVTLENMTLDQAKKQGALAFFTGKYQDQVKVYSIGNFSKEVCGGPHIDFTGRLGRFKIIKEEAAGANTRRIYAVLE